MINSVKNIAEDVAAKVSDVVGNVFGVDSETVEILKAKYDELMADGKISKDEVFATLEEFAAEKGISPEILEKAKAIFGVSSELATSEPVEAVAGVETPTEPTV